MRIPGEKSIRRGVRWLRSRFRPGGLVLLYHRIADADDAVDPFSLCVSRRHFADHLEILQRFATVVSLEEMWLAAREGRLPPRSIAVSFDDGYADNLYNAKPLLEEYGSPATVFVVAEAVGTTNAWGGREEPGIPTLPLLAWDELGELVQEGLELGSHSLTHARLSGLGDAELAHELAASATLIDERAGQHPRTFCYPYGDFDERAERLAANSYACACTTALRPLGPKDRPHRLPRLDAFYWRDPGRLEAFGTAAFRRHLRWRRALRGLRGLLR